VLSELVKEFDPDRFYWPSSPLADFGVRASYSNTSGDMHYWGVWHGREPFENFKKINARFMSEYGFQSFPEFKTVQTYTLPDDRDITSEVMSAHQRSGIGNERIRMYMEWEYHVPKAFEDMLYLSQVLQARGIKDAMESHRLDKPYCMGTLYWQINDCWPVASWSSIDYYGRWKALHYFAKKAYAPVVVIPTLDKDQVAVSVVSDRRQVFKGKVQMQVLDFTGRVLWEAQPAVVVPANGNEKVFNAPRSTLLDDSALTQALLCCTLIEKNEAVSQNILYFKAPKDLELPHPNVTMTVKETPDGYVLTLVSENLAKNVYLTCDQGEGFFTDNYFDLLPDRKVTVLFRTSERMSYTDGIFKIRTLRETYE
jgi:beta-mannosidase